MAPPTAGVSKDEVDSSLLLGIELAHPESGEEVVISGMSGTFPDSVNVADFRDNILNKKDLVSGDNRRWDLVHQEIPSRGGRLFEIEKFDASFFGIPYKQAHVIDCMVRICLEKVYEAIVDAGIHISEMPGNRTGVFVGSCFSESEKTWFYEQIQDNGFAPTGCIRSMLSNRLSYWLGVNGPSYNTDTACSSALYALEHAYRAIRTGDCDMAIVVGANLCLHPFVTLQFARLGVLNMDGKCKCFDKTADGYTRSEAIVAMVLQKAKGARRNYCQVVHAKTNCDGYKEHGITYPSGQIQTLLLKDFYAECGVNPSEITYVEAHGTGTKVGDPEEVIAIDSIFCKEKRDEPLRIGSVKSNIGHAESASGSCSIAKVILNMETNCLMPNINYNETKPEMNAIIEGRLKVVTEVEKWHGKYAAVNNFGFGGSNCHVLLKSVTKEKINNGIPRDDIPRLVYVSGRTSEAIHSIIDDVLSRPMDAEYIGLLHEVYKFDTPGHFYRGYAVITKEKLITRESDYYSYSNKPLWFIFSGLGCQWSGMGTDLIKIPVFAAAIEKCHQVLTKKNINILEIITNSDLNSAPGKLVESLIGITAVQIGLIDILKAIDVKPAGIIGYSIGEIACGYYEECLTLEEAILTSYYLAQATARCKNNNGSLISVDIESDKIKELLLPGTEVACINADENCIVAGSSTKIKELIKKLKEKKIVFEELDSNNFAYHSSYVNEIASSVLKHLKAIIRSPKKRSEKWISGLSFTEKDKFSANLCSAEFLSAILVKSINFEQTYDKVPTNALTFEISPHGLLQNVLRRSVFDDCINISLMHKNSNSAEALLTAIGKLYMAGYNPRIEKIYPKISFPVSRSTPMISHLVKWDHSHDWFVTRFEVQDMATLSDRTVPVAVKYEETEFVTGHVIDGRILYPATGYLVLVWETVAMHYGLLYNEMPIVFENVKFNRATNVPKEGRVYLNVMVQKGSGNFEIAEGGSAIVSGRAYVPEDIESESINLPFPVPEQGDYYRQLNSKDIYKELRLRGYNYSGLFRGIHSCDTTATVGQIYWKNNWVSFMDTVLQMQILQEDTRGLFVPTGIEHVSINVDKQKRLTENLEENGTLPVYVNKNIQTIVCGGVEIRGISVSAINKKKQLGVPVLETYHFIPNIAKLPTLEKSIKVFINVIMQNQQQHIVKVVELLDEFTPEAVPSLTSIIQQCLDDTPLKHSDIVVVATKPLEIEGVTISDRKLVSETNCMVVIASNLLQRKDVLQLALNALMKGGFIISREDPSVNISEFDSTSVNILAVHTLESEHLILLSKATETTAKNYIDVSDPNNKFEWVPILQEAVKTDPNTVIYVQGDPYSGILGFMNCLRREHGMEGVRCFFIMDEQAPKFDPSLEFYSRQLDKGLAANVLKGGEWGNYNHLLQEEVKEVEVEHAYVNVTLRGDLSSLRWLQGSLSSNCHLDSNQILVHTYYSAMNFRDIMTATGRIAPEVVAKGRFEQECVQGLEFSGRLSNGRRVMGMTTHMAMATMLKADSWLLWEIPDAWSLEDAVTIPVTYGTALFALIYQGKIRKGMSILIHAGSGGVGQAAINIALFYECKVYTTVGTPEKREFIKKQWPQIKDNQIGNSRDTSFEQLIMTETNGRGVDLILNSLAEEKLQASVRCLAKGGSFLEIGKFDLSSNNPLPLNMFVNGRSYHGIMLDLFFYTANNYKQYIYGLVQKHINLGAVKPLPRCIFKEDEIEDMFRFMATGKHMGKVILKIRDEEPEKKASPSVRYVKAIPRYFSTGFGSYIIIGGLGGFGLELADWLILRGVTKMVLTSRKGITTGYQALRIRFWKRYGIELVISTEDITSYDGCKKMIEQATELGPVEAIFNLAVDLKDSLFSNQTVENFVSSFKPKAIATKYLDKISRDFCPELRLFVVFSSVSCGKGNMGQSNYGMANSVMERICEKRKEDGFPALAIEWGAVGDVGLVAEMQEENTELVISGTLQQRINSCLSVLDQFLQQSHPVVGSMLVAEKRAGGGAAENIIDAVINILGIRDIRTVSVHSTLAELGMDSIMAVEIKQTLEREFEVFLTPQDIRSMTFSRLHEIAAERESGQSKAEKDEKDLLTVGKEGLNYLIRNLGDEEMNNQPFVVLPSDASPNCNEYVLLVPGIEGISPLMKTLASGLTAKAVCLQLGFNSSLKTFPEMAQSLLENALAHLPDPTSRFVIVAYSFGAAITLELATLLETQGRVGRIVLIDGAPRMLKTMVQQYVPVDDDVILQNAVVAGITNLVSDSEQITLIKPIFEQAGTWEEKVDLALKHGPEQYSKEHYRNIFESIYIRVKVLMSYEPQITKLNSTIKLLKPTLPTVAREVEDYGLSAFTTQPVEIVYVTGNHATIVENVECVHEVNKILAEEPTAFKESIVSYAIRKETVNI